MENQDDQEKFFNEMLIKYFEKKHRPISLQDLQNEFLYINFSIPLPINL